MAKQAAIVAILIAGVAAYVLATARSRPTSIEAGFWFEDVAFESNRLGAPLTSSEIATIQSVARAVGAGRR